MARPQKNGPDLKDERDEALLAEYNKVIESFGPNARFMAKSELYRIAALPFFITPASARCIIQKMMKVKSKDNRCRNLKS